MPQNNNYVQQMQQSLQTLLPQATQRAVESYHNFAQKSIEGDAKSFAAHHAACKAALAHVEYLTKLAQWLSKQNNADAHSTNDNDAMVALVHQARLQLLQVQQVYEHDT